MNSILIHNPLLSSLWKTEGHLNSVSLGGFTINYRLYSKGDITKFEIDLLTKTKTSQTSFYTADYDITLTPHDSIKDSTWVTFDSIGSLSYNNTKIGKKRFSNFIQMLHNLKESCYDNGINAKLLDNYRFSDDNDLVRLFLSISIQLDILYTTDYTISKIHNGYKYLQAYSNVLNEEETEIAIRGYLVPHHLTDKNTILNFMNTKRNKKEFINCIIKGRFNWNLSIDTYIKLLKSGNI